MHTPPRWLTPLRAALTLLLSLATGCSTPPAGSSSTQEPDHDTPAPDTLDAAPDSAAELTPDSDAPLPDSDTLTPEGDLPEAPRALTYYQDVKPIIHASCETCHAPGQVGPYPLDTYETLSQHANIALASIDLGRMPPWSPDPECRHYERERLIDPSSVEMLRAWIAQGMQEGDAAAWTPPADLPITPTTPDLVGRQNGAYTPTAQPTDDYQCFVIDLDFDQDTYIRGTHVIPGDRQLVHHANLFLVNPTSAPTVERLQADSPEAGYECFGDAGISQTNLVGAWVPGAEPVFFPDDTALVFPRGARLVLQVHYNTLYTPPAPVESLVHLYTTPEPPSRRVRAMPIANLTFDVAPGEKESVHTLNVRNSTREDWLVIGTGPHLHLLATSVKVEVIRHDEAQQNVCLVDIPRWDFNWQQEYRFRDDEWVNVRPGDTVRLTCTFDNSPENQPIVNGERLPPQRVRWGAKTADEMCLNFLVTLQDYDPTFANGPLCSEFKVCREQCDEPFSVGCIFNCAAIEEGCGECLLFGAQSCASRYCRSQLTPTLPCLLECAQGAQGGGDIDTCLRAECPEPYTELESCIRPYIEQGQCNQYIDDCNVEL